MGQAFDEYWRQMVERQPELGDADGAMRIRVGAFRRQLERAFEAGVESSKPVSVGERLADLAGRIDRMIGGGK